MIRNYWSEMFGEFETTPGKFEIPGFPEPLMSAHFDHRNQVGEKCEHSPYQLCYFGPLNQKFASSRVRRESLKSAIARDSYWRFQNDNHPESVEFMKRLLPFLVAREKPHDHFFIEEAGELVASGVVGVTSKIVLAFNGAIRKDSRAQGLAREVMKAIRGHYYQHAFFYWTKHQWFTGGAEQVEAYRILER